MKIDLLKRILKRSSDLPLRRIFLFLLLLYCILTLVSCKKEKCSLLNSKINQILKDGIVSNIEFQEFSDLVQKNKTCFPQSVSPCGTQEFLSTKIDELKFEIDYCKQTQPVLKVYMENSDSMDGYLRGGHDFKDSITNLIVRLKSHSSKVEYNFVNSDVYPIRHQLDGFIKEVSLVGGTSYFRSKSSTFGSDLNLLFKKIINSTEPDEVSLFITDGIYSIQNISNIQTELLHSQSFTMDAFVEGIQSKGISTLVLQFEANFNGNYFDMRHNPHPIKAKKPFYIFLVGNSKILGDLWRERGREIKKIVNLKNYAFFQKDFRKEINFMILSSYKKKGFKKIIDRQKGILSGIKTDHEGNFAFSLALDLSAFKGNEKLIEDINNYSLPSGCNLELESFNEGVLDLNEKIHLKKFIGSPTHIYTISCDKSILKDEKINIALGKNSEDWTKNMSLNSDIFPAEWISLKTFGLEHLMKGISDAYNELSNAESIFVLQITLER